VIPAGKAFNVSRTLAALGVPNVAMGLLGRESLETFDAAARLAGIGTEWTPIAARTRENLTLIDPISSTATHIRDAGPTISKEELDHLSRQLRENCRPGVLVVFCGSLPPGVMAEQLANLIRACHASGARIAVDTSGDPLRRAAECELYLLKPNAQELAELLGRKPADMDETIEAGRTLAKRFPIVIITLGEHCAYAFAGSEAWHARAPVAPEVIRSTVGCGDAFLAGFIASHQQGAALEVALAHAVAVSAASAMTDLPASFADQDRVALLESITPARLRTRNE
jgi:1-phosphofructokinase family hexose kinase